MIQTIEWPMWLWSLQTYVDVFGEGVVMGCGTGDHYASTPSKVVLEGYVVVAVEMLLLEKRYSLDKLCLLTQGKTNLERGKVKLLITIVELQRLLFEA